MKGKESGKNGVLGKTPKIRSEANTDSGDLIHFVLWDISQLMWLWIMKPLCACFDYINASKFTKGDVSWDDLIEQKV
jgi:hypothetical protein